MQYNFIDMYITSDNSLMSEEDFILWVDSIKKSMNDFEFTEWFDIFDFTSNDFYEKMRNKYA